MRKDVGATAPFLPVRSAVEWPDAKTRLSPDEMAAFLFSGHKIVGENARPAPLAEARAFAVVRAPSTPLGDDLASSRFRPPATSNCWCSGQPKPSPSKVESNTFASDLQIGHFVTLIFRGSPCSTELAAELVRLKVDAIVTLYVPVVGGEAGNKDSPIVAIVADPVNSGIVSN